MPHGLEFLIEGRDFHESGEIAAWSDGNGDMRDWDAQDFVVLPVDSQSINLLDVVPIL